MMLNDLYAVQQIAMRVAKILKSASHVGCRRSSEAYSADSLWHPFIYLGTAGIPHGRNQRLCLSLTCTSKPL